MPNQDPTNTNNQPQTNAPADPVSSVPFSSQIDLPPLPPEFQNLENPQTNPAPAAGSPPPTSPQGESGSAAPPPAFANIAPAPKKKFGTKKIIATILGIIGLVGAVGAGTYLVGQKQLFNQKASDPQLTGEKYQCPNGNAYCIRCTCGCWSYSSGCTDGVTFCNTDCPTPTPGTDDGGDDDFSPCQYSCLQKVDNLCPTGTYSREGDCVEAGTACCYDPGADASPSPTPTPFCGSAPSNIPSFTKPEYTISTDSLGSSGYKLYIHYYDYNGGTQRKIGLSLNGTSKTVTVNSDGQVDTGLTITNGDILKVTGIEEPYQEAFCAPSHATPHMSLGWINPNSGDTCGTTLPGPPTEYTPFSPVSISTALSALTASGNTVLSKECWADWREWPGDYDFEDFFLAFSASPGTTAAPYCAAVKAYDTEWKALSSSDLTSLSEGSVVSFCVSGLPLSHSFDKAQFTINGVEQDETYVNRPQSAETTYYNEFCQSYTIPSGTTTFTITGKIHHSTLGWF